MTRTFGRPVMARHQRITKRLASVAVVATCQYGRPNMSESSRPTTGTSSVESMQGGQAPAPRPGLGREHVGEAALGLLGDRLHHRLRRMAEHRSGIAEAQVVVR